MSCPRCRAQCRARARTDLDCRRSATPTAACRASRSTSLHSPTRMSPNMLPVTMTSNCLGDAPAASPRCRRTCAKARRRDSPRTSVTTSRHSCVTSSTLALSTEHSRPLRLRAASNADGNTSGSRVRRRRSVLKPRRPPLSTITPRGLAKVDPAGELAHDQDVEPGHKLGFQRRRPRQAAQSHGWAQIGIQVQLRPQPQQPPLRALCHRQSVPFGTAHRAHEHGICVSRSVQRRRRQRRAVPIDGNTANVRIFERQTQFRGLALRGNRRHAHHVRHDLRPDAVTGQHQHSRACS